MSNLPPPLDAVLAATRRVAPAGLTHASLTESCTRPPGTPPSQCGGSLRMLMTGSDAAQPGEGEATDMVTLSLYQCVRCRQTLAVSVGSAGWRLRNEYDPAKGGPPCASD